MFGQPQTSDLTSETLLLDTSCRCEQTPTAGQHLATLLRTLRQRGFHVVIVAHSMGCRVALHALARDTSVARGTAASGSAAASLAGTEDEAVESMAASVAGEGGAQQRKGEDSQRRPAETKETAESPAVESKATASTPARSPAASTPAESTPAGECARCAASATKSTRSTQLLVCTWSWSWPFSLSPQGLVCITCLAPHISDGEQWI